MANPYAGKAGSTSAAKVKALTGKSTKGHVYDGSPVNKARGGAVKGKTNITINIGKGGGEKQPVPVPIPMGGPPPGPPPMAPPPPGPMPGPMMRKAGGRVKMTAGAETGEGRLQKARAYKRG